MLYFDIVSRIFSVFLVLSRRERAVALAATSRARAIGSALDALDELAKKISRIRARATSHRRANRASTAHHVPARDRSLEFCACGE
jgi:hypothetical protein